MAQFPASLSAKMALWLSPEDIAATGTRAQWVDRQGRTCSTAGTNPIAAAGPDFSRRSFLFDQGSFGYNLNLTGTTNSEIWLLIKGVPGNQAGFRFGTAGSASHYPFSDGNVYDDTASNARISFSHGGLANNWNVLRIVVGATTKQYFINGNSMGSFAATPTQYRTDVLIGGPNAATGASVSEALIFNQSLTTTEATNLLAYLQNPLNQMTDSFASAGTIAVGGSNFTPATEVTAYTAEAAEPGAGTNSGWLTFVAPATAQYAVDTSTSGSDTVVGIYTGTAVGALTQVVSASSGKAYFRGVAGTRYYIRVALESGTAGTYVTKLDYDNRWLAAVKADGALWAWTFEETDGSTTVQDLTGNGRAATLNTTNALRSLKRHLSAFAGAFRGNGTDVATGPSITWPTSGAITIEFSVWWGLRGRQQMFLSWIGASLDILSGMASVLNAFGVNNLAGTLHGYTNPPGEYWHHIMYVIPMQAATTGQKVYVDGVLQAGLVGTGFTVPALGTAQLRVGNNTGGWELGPEAMVTGVAAYPTELTAAQAKTHYQLAFGTFTDLFQDAMPITPPEGGAPLPPLDSSTWATEAGEPLTNVATRTAWAMFDATDSSTYQLDTIGSTYDTSVAVYTGLAIGSLSLVVADNSSGGSNNAKVQFTATPGTRYYFQIGASPGAVPDSGTITPHFLRVASTGAATAGATAATAPTMTTFLLKGRSTRAFDSLPGG